MDDTTAQRRRYAERQARLAMERAARKKGVITYTELAQEITAMSLKPYDSALSNLLCRISRRDDAAGRGMLSAVVVHEGGNEMPGPGFFELAAELKTRGRRPACVLGGRARVGLRERASRGS